MRIDPTPLVLFATLSSALLLSAPASAVACGSRQQQESWPAWRGADGLGLAAGNPPTEWSEDKNVKWKTEIPGLGLSTPLTWGDRIYVTTAVKGVNDVVSEVRVGEVEATHVPRKPARLDSLSHVLDECTSIENEEAQLSTMW